MPAECAFASPRAVWTAMSAASPVTISASPDVNWIEGWTGPRECVLPLDAYRTFGVSIAGPVHPSELGEIGYSSWRAGSAAGRTSDAQSDRFHAGIGGGPSDRGTYWDRSTSSYLWMYREQFG